MRGTPMLASPSTVRPADGARALNTYDPPSAGIAAGHVARPSVSVVTVVVAISACAVEASPGSS